MNYANMIEEKHLKKSYIVAVLVSTIVGSITASMGLHDKIQEKRDKKKQKALDGKQNDEIEQLKQKLENLDKGERPDHEDKKKPAHSRSTSRSSSRHRRRRHDDYDEDDFTCSARRSRAMIERMYENNLSRVGQDYARGDVITENRLQAQIIQLQQTVINVLQDALYNERSLTAGDMQRLIAAQIAARNGSLDALQDQYNRMLAEKRVPSRMAWDSAPNRLLIEDATVPPKRQQTFPSRHPSPRSPPSPPRRAKTLPPSSSTLFCYYSEDLQTSSRALSSAFSPSNDRRCPACGIIIPVDTRDVWVFSTQIPAGNGEAPKVREYRMDARFVVKCHMDDGRFACALCNRFRDSDCICRSVEALVKHLGTAHTTDEYEEDVDLVRIKNGELIPA